MTVSLRTHSLSFSYILLSRTVSFSIRSLHFCHTLMYSISTYLNAYKQWTLTDADHRNVLWTIQPNYTDFRFTHPTGTAKVVISMR